MVPASYLATRRRKILLVSSLIGCLLVFLGLALITADGRTPELDERLLLSLRSVSDPADPIGPTWVEEMARDITALGSVIILNLIALSAVLFLLLKDNFRAALFVFIAFAGGFGVSTGLKEVFDRPRPQLVAHGTKVHSTSFPSAHSMMSAVTFLTFGALFARWQTGRQEKWFLLGTAVFLTLLVGASRVYLGVHWPSDVAAGWAAGAAWALLCVLVAGMRSVRKAAHEEAVLK